LTEGSFHPESPLCAELPVNPQLPPAFWRHWWSESFASKSSRVLWFQLYDNGKEVRPDPAMVGFINGKGRWEPV